MAVAVADNQYRRSKIHPKKFALWVACASMMMLFAAFTSAYVVRQAAGNWLEFQLPSLFFYSTAVILLSSLTLHGSYYSFKQGNANLYRLLLIVSLLLGLGFVVMQYMGWNQLNAIGVPLDGNPAGSFVYVISGVHAAHVLGGIAAISLALMHAYVLPYKLTERRKLRFELTLTYWHFVDFLWVYLLGFFLLTGS